VFGRRRRPRDVVAWIFRTDPRDVVVWIFRTTSAEKQRGRVVSDGSVLYTRAHVQKHTHARAHTNPTEGGVRTCHEDWLGSVNTRARARAHTHKHTHTHTHTYIYTRTHAHTHTETHTHTRARAHTHTPKKGGTPTHTHRKPCKKGGLHHQCVLLYFIIKPILGNRYGPGVIPEGRGPGVDGSSPFTLTTSLDTPVPSSSSSNGPTTTPLTTRKFYPGNSVVWAGPKFVRPHW